MGSCGPSTIGKVNDRHRRTEVEKPEKSQSGMAAGRMTSDSE